MPWDQPLKWDGSNGKWNPHIPWDGIQGMWGEGGGSADPVYPDGAAYAWPLTSDLNEKASGGDMGSQVVARASDRTYVDSNGNVQVARAEIENLIYPSDPSAYGAGFGGVDGSFVSKSWGVESLANALYIADASTARTGGLPATSIGSGKTCRISAYCEMGDGSVPRLKDFPSKDSNTDLSVYTGNSGWTATGLVGAAVSGNIYRVSFSFVTGSTVNTARTMGVWSGMSGKALYLSGFMFEIFD